MKHAHDFLRWRLTNQDPMSFVRLRISEWSQRFEQLMRNRLILGAYRYGRIHQPGKPKFDRVKYMHTKLERYANTGNLEALVDVANLALLEFEEGQHPQRHFAAMDDTAEHCTTPENNTHAKPHT